jgi:hypothetical protein
MNDPRLRRCLAILALLALLLAGPVAAAAKADPQVDRFIADLAAARARLARARGEVDAKAARNADLRRQLLVVPER